MVVPVVLAGGKGVRLWPVSREAMPKPYVRARGVEETLLQATLRRISLLDTAHQALVVCNREHEFIVSAQAQTSARNGIRLLLEPEGRNTAPAICAAALVLAAQGLDEPMLVLPADHLIANEASFVTAVSSAAALAEQDLLVTFAITPQFPATGYGYVKIGAAIDAAQRQYRIEAFVEKPDAVLATEFLARGGYAWNSGMFVFKPSVLIRAFAALQPEILQACRGATAIAASGPGGNCKLDRTALARAPSISIDYAIMEKASNAATVLADFGWSDVGDWQAVWSVADRDACGNAVFGNAEVVESSGSLVHSDGPLLVAVGLSDMIAVATKDAIVVAPKERAQDIKRAVDQLKAAKRPEVESGKRVFRPWGSFEQLHVGPGFQVKELAVLPGAKLSLQRHQFRGEHWVCIAGEGIALRDGERLRLTAGAGVFIPQGALHRLENPGPELLRIVETQIGSYTGEDDIERVEDAYGRV